MVRLRATCLGLTGAVRGFESAGVLSFESSGQAPTQALCCLTTAKEVSRASGPVAAGELQPLSTASYVRAQSVRPRTALCTGTQGTHGSHEQRCALTSVPVLLLFPQAYKTGLSRGRQPKTWTCSKMTHRAVLQATMTQKPRPTSISHRAASHRSLRALLSPWDTACPCDSGVCPATRRHCHQATHPHRQPRPRPSRATAPWL